MPEIVTLTMNPALDISTTASSVVPTSKLRCAKPQHDPGGGRINVARVAQVLGGSVAAFPSGGPSGRVPEDLPAAEHVPSRSVRIGGSIRESFAVTDQRTDEQYRFVPPRPELTLREQDECLAALADAASNAIFVVASGSIPPGVPTDFHQRVGDVAAALTVPGTGLCRLADVDRLFAEQTDADTTDTHETHCRAI